MKLLKIYGPLSSRAITKLIGPDIKNQRVREVLQRLLKRGLVIKRFEKHFDGTGTFYQLAQDPIGQALVAKALDCLPEELLQPEFRYRELIHNQNSALCAHEILKVETSATMIRDFDFHKSDIAKRAMLSKKNDFELQPDLLLFLPQPGKDSVVRLAIEIEKTRKSDKRLLIKLKKYADRTIVDGVIYFCDSLQIANSIRSVYLNKVLSPSSRIAHYPNNFMLFARSESDEPVVPFDLYNCAAEKVDVTQWIAYLKSTDALERRDHLFKTPIVPYGRLEAG